MPVAEPKIYTGQLQIPVRALEELSKDIFATVSHPVEYHHWLRRKILAAYNELRSNSFVISEDTVDVETAAPRPPRWMTGKGPLTEFDRTLRTNREGAEQRRRAEGDTTGDNDRGTVPPPRGFMFDGDDLDVDDEE